MEWYRSIATTDPSGDCQPDALEIILTDQPSNLRQPCRGQVKKLSDQESCQLLDYHNRMYGELKSDKVEAESQNIEQMVGLFRKTSMPCLVLHATQALLHQGC